MAFGAFFECRDSNCMDSPTDTAWFLCMEEECLDLLLACVGVECETHADCDSENTPYCAGGMCSVAYGRTYWLDIGSAEIADQEPSTGEAWDAMGGAPDAFVEVFVDGKSVLETFADDDTFSPIWKAGVNVEVWEDTTFEIQVWDEDATVDDWIGEFLLDPVEIQWLLEGGQTIDVNNGGLISIEMGFLPPMQ